MTQGPIELAPPPRRIHIWAFGICIVIGGQLFSWNAGLVAGLVSYGIGFFLMGIAYLFLTLSMAEVSSALPFAGGIYGLARCTIGFYLDFMSGCFELIEYMLFVTSANMQTSRALLARWPAIKPYQPFIWVVVHALCFLLVYRGGRTFWNFNYIFAMLAMVIIFFYCLGAMTLVNMFQYAGNAEPFVGGFSSFLTALPLAAWPYAGIEGVTTLASDVSCPHRILPRAQVRSMITLLLTSWCIFLLSVSLPPGASQLPYEVAIMNGGFSASFNISTAESTILSLPVVLSSAPCFALSSSNIVVAMAQSRLLPSCFSNRHEKYKSPVNALMLIILLSFMTCFWLLYMPDFADVLFNLCMFFGFLTYIAQCLGYIYLKRYQSNLRRLFVSPVGISGAIFCIVIFGAGAVSILFFQESSGHSYWIMSTASIAILTFYYVIYARKQQTFSKAEQRQYFFANVGKLNYVKKSSRKLILGGKSTQNKQQPTTATANDSDQRITSFATILRSMRRISQSVYVVNCEPDMDT